MRPFGTRTYDDWHALAASKGWKVPMNDAFPKYSWIAFWKACDNYERNPESGRPVPPHRTGRAAP